MGCASWRVGSVAELEGALDEARHQRRPAVIVCDVDPHRMLLPSGAWWDVGVHDAAGMARQRWFG